MRLLLVTHVLVLSQLADTSALVTMDTTATTQVLVVSAPAQVLAAQELAAAQALALVLAALATTRHSSLDLLFQDFCSACDSRV